MKEYLEYMQYQQECLSELAPLITEHYHDLVTVLTPKQGMEIEFMDSQLNDMPYVWAECSICGDMALLIHRADENQMLHRECPYAEKGIYKVNSPRLLKSYATVRRKDFKESPY